MPSQSPTIASIVVLSFEICSANCQNLVTQLNEDAVFKGKVGNITANNTSINGTEVKVLVEEGSATCLAGCKVIPSTRFLYPFETNKDMSSVTSEFSERQLQQEFQSTVVNVIVDMAATGQSVDPAQLLEELETNKDTLNEGSFTIQSIVLATESPSSVPSSEPSATPSDSPSAKPSASPSESPSGKPSASPSDKPS